MGGADVRGDACGGKNVVHGGVPCAIPPAGRSRWDGQSRKPGIEGLPHPSVSEGEPRFFEWCGRRPKADNTVVKSRVAAVPHGRSVHPVKRVAPWWSLDRSRLDKVSARSAGRRVGKECVSAGRFRGWPCHKKKNTK